MKKLVLMVLTLAFTTSTALANGACVVDAADNVNLTLVSSRVEVQVESQIATVMSRQVFRNDLSADTTVMYAFPLPEGAASTALRWIISGKIDTATISATPQDTTLPGPSGELHPNLEEFLGETPLYFTIEDKIKKDSLVTVELEYVQLLPYELGNVEFSYPNDYSRIQLDTLASQELAFNLASPRTIEAAFLTGGHAPDSISAGDNTTYLGVSLYGVAATADYNVRYRLSSTELGLYSYSTYLPDSTLPDHHGGFLLFIAEPDPSQSADAIDKVFTLIIDRSGSMMGDKIVQARNAASFIMHNLNEGDKFNIVDYASEASVFRTLHVDYTSETRDQALDYISTLAASGGTNIGEAFSVAIPQFTNAPDSTANVIIFFTDGQPTVGTRDVAGLTTLVSNLITTSEKDIYVYTFGVGTDVNTQLLTQLAANNHGIASFLGSDELEVKISEFYSAIRNPVMLGTTLSFDPPLVEQTYPTELPNLYRGQQMIMTGRYQEPGDVTITIAGETYGQELSQDYEISLADSAAEGNEFLTKIWAKQKIEALLVEYYLQTPGMPQADIIRQTIVDISIGYGVISPFTSFVEPQDPGVGIEDENDELADHATPLELLGNFPNPFNPVTTIRFRVGTEMHENVLVKVYNALGQLVRVLAVRVDGPGIYEVTWNGITQDGAPAASGLYVYVVDYGQGMTAGRMHLAR